MYTMKHINHLRGKGQEGHASVRVCFLQTMTVLSSLLPNGREVVRHGNFCLSYLHGTFNWSQQSCSLKALFIEHRAFRFVYASMKGNSIFLCIVHSQVCVFTIFLCWRHLSISRQWSYSMLSVETNAVTLELARDLQTFRLFLGLKTSSIICNSSKQQ